MTPTNRYETNQALHILQTECQATHTVRRLFTRTTDRIERLQFDLTRTTEELQRIQAKERLRKQKNPGRRKVNPNGAFVTLQDIIGTQIAVETNTTPPTQANVGQIGQEQRRDDRLDHADAFGVITRQLGSIEYN
jgi:hypothetical protein